MQIRFESQERSGFSLPSLNGTEAEINKRKWPGGLVGKACDFAQSTQYEGYRRLHAMKVEKILSLTATVDRHVMMQSSFGKLS